MLNPLDLGYRQCRDHWVKPVEIHDTVVSGDKVVVINTSMLFCVTAQTIGFFIHDGSLRARGIVVVPDDITVFERYCLSIKHWFYIRPQIKQFQEAVRSWTQEGGELGLKFSELNI
jgi:hypothetical protein